MAAHKHWRIVSLTNNGGSEIGFAEIEMATSVGGPDITASATATASGSYGGSYLPGNAIDDGTAEWVGPSGTKWAWFGVEFPTPQAIRDLRMKCRSGLPTQTMKGILFLGSDDANFNPFATKIYLMIADVGTWTSGAFKNITVPINPIPDNASSTPRSCWRTVFPNTSGGTEVSLAEVALKSSVGGANLATGGTAASSSLTAGNGAANAFDASTATQWISEGNHKAGWLQYLLTSAAWIVEVGWTSPSATPTRAPVEAYILAGDGNDYDDTHTDWVVAGRITNQTTWGATETRTLAVNNTPLPSTVRATAMIVEVLTPGAEAPVRVPSMIVEVLANMPLAPVRVTGVIIEVLADLPAAPLPDTSVYGTMVIASEWDFA